MPHDTTARSDEEALFDALRQHIGTWYQNAYGATEPHQAMIGNYATSAPRWFNLLLKPYLERFAEAPPARVLDVGCGFAHIPVYLALRWPQTEIVATDVGDNYYWCGQAAARDLGLKNISFKTMSVNDLAERESFDLVVSCNMLNFMNSRAKLTDALTRIWGAAKLGGNVTIHTPHFGSLREPFTRTPLLHLLPVTVQDRIVRRLGKRSTLLDVRNPSLGEIKRTILPLGGRFLGVTPNTAYRRLKSTHITLWFEK